MYCIIKHSDAESKAMQKAIRKQSVRRCNVRAKQSDVESKSEAKRKGKHTCAEDDGSGDAVGQQLVQHVTDLHRFRRALLLQHLLRDLWREGRKRVR
jgi:hypothetical protein